MELSEARRRAEPALAIQRRELAGDNTTPNRALAAFRAGPVSALSQLIEALRTGSIEERQLAARLLVDSTLDGNQIFDHARAALAAESDPQVLSLLASALGHSRSRSAIADLDALASHDRPAVRFAVAGSLSMCAEGLFGSIAEPLLALSGDLDDDVRWSAAFELGEWLGVSDEPRIRQRLAELATDPADEVSSVASGALADVTGDSSVDRRPNEAPDEG